MSGNSLSLHVFLADQFVATLALQDGQLYWDYSILWREQGFAVSPHLPLNEKIPTLTVQWFIRNLLPEGSALDELLQTFHLSKSNTYGLIQALGLDTPGSLVLIANQTLPNTAEFRLIRDKELEERLNNRGTASLIMWDGKPRLSVAGVQDKINVVLNEQGEMGFGEGTLCSTHILKFEKQALSTHLVLNEYISMSLAKRCGLNVAKVQLMRFGANPALLVERFDRKFITINKVKRRHIIDGCQALNLPPESKYEQNFGNSRDVAHIRDGVSLIKLFDFANKCSNPATTKQHILDWVLFNILICNSDAHGKNISFFIGLNGISLTPFYDLVNIGMYSQFDHQLAMALGDDFDADTITAFQLADFAETCQLPKAFVAKRLQLMIGKLMPALDNLIISTHLDKLEKKFLIAYQEMVSKRCQHLLEQSAEISSAKLDI